MALRLRAGACHSWVWQKWAILPAYRLLDFSTYMSSCDAEPREITEIHRPGNSYGVPKLYEPEKRLRGKRLADFDPVKNDSWLPSQLDNKMIFEMSLLLKKGNAATWEADDIVRSNGGIFKPYHVAEVLKQCKVDCDVAFSFFKWALTRHDYQPDASVYNIMLTILGLKGRIDDLRDVLRDMKERKVNRNNSTYFVVMQAFFDGKMVEEALETFDEMEHSNCPPLMKDYNYVMDKLLKLQCSHVVPIVFKNMKLAGHKPDVLSYNLVLNSMCKLGQVSEAFKLFKKGKNSFVPDVYTYTILIDGLGKSHRLDAACELFQEMIDNHCQPNVATFNVLVDSLGRVGKVNQAIDLFWRMLNEGCVPSEKSYSVVISAFDVAGKIEEAYIFFKDLAGKGIVPEVTSYNILLSKLSKAAKVSVAMELFTDVRNMRPCPADLKTYNIMIDLLAKSGRLQDAWTVFQDVKAAFGVPDSYVYNTLILRLARGGKIGLCFKVLEEMTYQGITPNQITYTGIIEGLIKVNQIDNALKYLEEMKDAGYKPNASTLGVLIKILSDMGRHDIVDKLWTEMPVAKFQRPDMCNFTASANCA